MPPRLSPTSRSFLNRLLATPGPSGFEVRPARIWRAEMEAVADTVTVDPSGNSIASLNVAGSPRVLVTGHIDEIGFMVTHVSDEGFLYFAPVGGWDPEVVVGQRVQILGRRGTVDGVVGKRAIHLAKKGETPKPSTFEDLWIDIGVKSKREADRHLTIGDVGVLEAEVTDLPNGRIVSRAIDNRIGAFVAAETLRILARRRALRPAVFAIATVQEEIGFSGGGARPGVTALAPDVAIVVDVTHATDYPGGGKKEHGDHRLGGGPVLNRGSVINPRVFAMLLETAQRESIPYTIQASPKYSSTDADSIFNAVHGIPTGLVSIPNRYMHSPNEMVALSDVVRAVRLIAAAVARISSDTDFTPR